MPWTATLIDKTFSNGVYSATIRYTDGTHTVDETYRSWNPTATWLPDTARDRISQLGSAAAFDITPGQITPSSVPTVDANVDLFRKRCRILEIAKLLIDLGVIQPTNPKVVALGNWIKNNFDSYVETL